MERRELQWFPGQLEVEAVHELIISGRQDTNRKTALETDDPRHLPAIEQFSRKPIVFRHGQFPHITEHEAMPRIELGE